MPEELPTTTPLTYERHPAFYRRKRFRRSILAVFTLCLATAIWHWHQPIWNEAGFLYWQHQCLNYTAPNDQIVGMYDTVDAMNALSEYDLAFTVDKPLGAPYFVGRTCRRGTDISIS